MSKDNNWVIKVYRFFFPKNWKEEFSKGFGHGQDIGEKAREKKEKADYIKNLKKKNEKFN